MAASLPSPPPSAGESGPWSGENRQLAELLEQAAEGSAAAFEAVFDSMAACLLAEVRNVVGKEHAEDVLADVFLQIWKKLATYDRRRGPPDAWLKSIARRQSLGHGGQTVAGNGDATARVGTRDMAEVVPAHQNPGQLLSRSEECKILQLSPSGSALSRDERNVIGLAYCRGHTQQEIADITGLPLGTVTRLMLTAQDRLRPQLAAMFTPDGAAVKNRSSS